VAGRDFGPPPSIVLDFNVTWRNWLNLVYRKLYKRTYIVELLAYQSVSPASPMVDGVIGLVPVVLADDTTDEFRNLSFFIPNNWIVGSDIIVTANFINTTVQVGVKNVITKITYNAYASDELANGAGTVLTDTLTLVNNVAANTSHESGSFTIPGTALALNDTVALYLQRDAATDTCVGDVGYQNLIIEYSGLLNHE
jgi:hypothetical protein